MASNPYTFTEECDVCDGRPVYKDLGMCAVCTHGTASALWDWLDFNWKGKERKLAIKYTFEEIFEKFGEDLFDKKGNIDPIAAMILHIDQQVLDKIERLL